MDVYLRRGGTSYPVFVPATGGTLVAKILVAGKDLQHVDSVCATIESAGHETVTAIDGLEAFEKTISDKPDLVILEIALDTFDGYETCQMLRGYPDISQTLPIIFLTSEDLNPRKMDQSGATDQLPKHHLSIDLTDLLVRYLGTKAGG